MYVSFEITSRTENNMFLEIVYFALSSICIKLYPVNGVKDITLEV